MPKFDVFVGREGTKANLKVTVPYKTVATMQLPAPCWVRMRVAGGDPFFAMSRRTQSRNSVDIALPHWCVSRKLLGETVSAELEDAKPYRARAWTDQKGFDWLPFVRDEHYFPTETVDGKLLLHSRHESPYTIRRVTPLIETYRVLGFYQAEGSKSGTAADFSFANSNAGIVAQAVADLHSIGFDKSRLSRTILRAPSEDPAEARAAYAQVDVRIVAERVRPGKGEHACLIQAVKSTPLLRLVRNALMRVFADDFPSIEAAKAYALRWLDGDGSFTIRGGSDDLMLCGHAAEHAVMKRALTQVFGWTFEAGSYHKNTDEGTQITLRTHEILDLIDAPAFMLSMNRVKMFLAFDRRTQGLVDIVEGRRSGSGGFVRWGIIKDGQPTALGERILDGRRRHARAIELARRVEVTRPELFGVKCVPYPPEMEGL